MYQNVTCATRVTVIRRQDNPRAFSTVVGTSSFQFYTSGFVHANASTRRRDAGVTYFSRDVFSSGFSRAMSARNFSVAVSYE